MLVSLMLVPLLRRYALKLKLMDHPDERKVHQEIIPRIGGLAMIVGTIASLLFWLRLDTPVLSYLLGVIIIAIFGTWDDRVQLGYRIKFVGQFIACLIVIFIGDVKVNSLPFLYDGIIPDFLSIPFTFFALLGITNAINLTDGLDGLAGGSSLISLCGIALL
ncbi:MAG: undecaprenyl/decaprenyl-phosphate alpha-N-acetylglucosaminyl 1-phosphate transferase, partial [Thiotrichales bacterium]|nr:undecaprenyl/decaprenyl-phosphate alpha-N-acetylglucosaminyl 1-phosphate transferase [Thiotrichales bacterium]